MLGICPEDTKSLYRRALANWHLGEVEVRRAARAVPGGGGGQLTLGADAVPLSSPLLCPALPTPPPHSSPPLDPTCSTHRLQAATTDLESILRRPVSDYSALAESSEVKKLARSMIRQIEASEERAEAMEQRMARALTATIPQDVDERYQDEPELALEDNTEEELPQALRDALRARERALLEESLDEEG